MRLVQGKWTGFKYLVIQSPFQETLMGVRKHNQGNSSVIGAELHAIRVSRRGL